MAVLILFTVLAGPFALALPPPAAFSFAGVSLASDLKEIAARHPHSSARDGYIYIDPADAHDHISGIGISGTGATRRVRITFETRDARQQPQYPACTEVEATLARSFGPPTQIRRFREESSWRADRIWSSQTEELTLLCFRDTSAGRYLAEAVQITRSQR
jgi:hypothetical protein